MRTQESDGGNYEVTWPVGAAIVGNALSVRCGPRLAGKVPDTQQGFGVEGEGRGSGGHAGRHGMPKAVTQAIPLQ